MSHETLCFSRLKYKTLLEEKKLIFLDPSGSNAQKRGGKNRSSSSYEDILRLNDKEIKLLFIVAD